MESALVGRTLAGDRNRHMAAALTLEGERLTKCWREALSDDSGAGKVRARVEKVHVPAAAAAKPGLTAEDLCRHWAQRNAVRDRQMVRTMCGGDCIFVREMCADPRSNRLLAGREVHLSRYQARADVEGWFLVGVVRCPDRLFVCPDEHHRAQ